MPSILALALNRNSWHERGWNGATSCARKKKKRKTEKRVEKGRLCDGLRVYPMIGNSASEKPENLILPFARGTTRDSFPDQRTTRLSRMVGRLAVIQRRAARKTGKQHCHRAKTLQFLIVSLKRWRRTSERASEEEMKRGEEEYPWGYYAR